ncbi:MAG: protein kinase [Acidobacteriota bacterium]
MKWSPGPAGLNEETESVAIPFQQLEGKYEILEKMSEGGMGAVYKVRHRLLDEIRVIKVMRPHLAEDAVLRKRFVREAKTAIRLRHANLAQVYDFTMDESGYFFLAMEFIDGIDLHGLVKLTKMVPLGVVLEMACQSLDVIGYLHKKEIVHRDISPDNLLISRDDEGNLLVKLIDLGIAKVREGNEHLTATGTFLGKVRYSSPEQFQSREGHEVDPRSDLYSFGVVLYELLTGVYPIKGKNISSLISGHLMHPPASFETSDPHGRIPDPLRALVLRALEKDQSERFQTAGEFQKVIGELQADFPVEKTFLDGVFEGQRTPTAKIPVDKPGSTQSRLDRNFGVETTPSQGEPGLPGPEMDLIPGPRSPRSGTEALPEGGRSGDRRTGTNRQIRALLLGAEKLIEAQHFDEARLQLETAENLAPGRLEVAKLVETLDRADTAMQRRREQAAVEIEELIRTEHFDDARETLRRRSEELGTHTVFTDLSEAVNQAEQAAAGRRIRAAEILEAARVLMKDDQWEDAVPMVREALVLTPGDAESIELLDQAEAGLSSWLESRRLQAEIERTAVAIEASLQAEDIEGVRRSLKLAEKLYGDHPRFAGFPEELRDLEVHDRKRRVEALRDEAAGLFDAEDFIAAGLKLEIALELEPDDRRLQKALAEAAESQRLKEEEATRRRIVEETSSGLDRLVGACRFSAAVVLLDAAVSSLGSFEEEPSLRVMVSKAAKAHQGMEKRIAKAVAEIGRAVEAQDFKRARAALDSARKMAADHPEALDAVDQAAEVFQVGERDFRRAKDIASAVGSIEKRLAEGQLDHAERELVLARRLYGPGPGFEDLAARTAEAIKTRERDRHRIKIHEALDAKKPFSDVVAMIEAALAFDPEDSDFRSLLVETRRAESDDAEARRRPAVQEALDEVDALIAGGREREALRVLAVAVEELGPFSEARALRCRLGKAGG